jgi:hypothetical protein
MDTGARPKRIPGVTVDLVLYNFLFFMAAFQGSKLLKGRGAITRHLILDPMPALKKLFDEV